MDDKDINDVVSQIKSKQKDLANLKGAVVIALKGNNNLSDLEKQIIQNISVAIIRKTMSASNFLISDDNSILQNAVSLRYVLEILITITLMNKEEEYKFINYIAFYNSQEDTQKIIIQELEREKNTLENYAKIYFEKTASFIEKNQKSLTLEEQGAILDDLIDKYIEREFFIIGTKQNLEDNTFGGLADLIDIAIIPKYKEKIKKLDETKKEIAKVLRNELIIKKCFPKIGNQESRVFKEIKDKKGKNGRARSWFEKAKDAGLEGEYNFIYKYTSNLSHFISYSSETKSNYDNLDEKFMVLNRLNSYLNKIYDNLKIFSQVSSETIDFCKEFGNVVDMGDDNEKPNE